MGERPQLEAWSGGLDAGEWEGVLEDGLVETPPDAVVVAQPPPPPAHRRRHAQLTLRQVAQHPQHHLREEEAKASVSFVCGVTWLV